MGWFWADGPASRPLDHPHIPHDASRSPLPGCPMHKHQKSADSMAAPPPASPPSACPVKHDAPAAPTQDSSDSILSKLNPLNFMFRDLSQKRAPNQTYALPTSREPSTIPKGDGDGNWEYPSPQQMYNALLRKGYDDTDVTAVESMVSVHNFLNEGAWNEVMEWEKRFAKGLYRGWKSCSRGENNFESVARKNGYDKDIEDLDTSLVRFQGRPSEMTPKAAMIQVMGWLYPSAYGTEPPFDRHDWYVSRDVNGERKEIRYVIDYYSGPPEPTGEPVFYLDVRPALTPSMAIARTLRWGCDVWWRASGGDARLAERAGKPVEA